MPNTSNSQHNTPSKDQNHIQQNEQRYVPKVLLIALVVANIFFGLAELKHGWVDVFKQWALLLIIIPAGITLVASPLKLRDKTFMLKNAFYMGWFVAAVYALNALRYLH